MSRYVTLPLLLYRYIGHLITPAFEKCAHGTLRLEFLMKIFSLFLQSWPRVRAAIFASPLSITEGVGRLWRNINRSSLHERNNYRGGGCALGVFRVFHEFSTIEDHGKRRLVTCSLHSRCYLCNIP